MSRGEPAFKPPGGKSFSKDRQAIYGPVVFKIKKDGGC
jgi:hypothetical protein